MPELPAITICTFVTDDTLIERLDAALDSDRYTVTACHSAEELIRVLTSDWSHFDSLILNDCEHLSDLIGQLHQAKLLLPTVILTAPNGQPDRPAADRDTAKSARSPRHFYHPAEVVHELDAASKGIEGSLERAIEDFLALNLSERADRFEPQPADKAALLLEEKQWILTEKLKERLGYLGVYYKRNPQRFLRNLSSSEAIELIEQLQTLYRDIVLSYFNKDDRVNSTIDEFVYLAFFADVSVTRVVEIHMNLMDEFSKQLQLEGRSEEILLDYRLTLIDVIAHLCEIYRRSIPRKSEVAES